MGNGPGWSLKDLTSRKIGAGFWLAAVIGVAMMLSVGTLLYILYRYYSPTAAIILSFTLMAGMAGVGWGLWRDSARKGTGFGVLVFLTLLVIYSASSCVWGSNTAPEPPQAATERPAKPTAPAPRIIDPGATSCRPDKSSKEYNDVSSVELDPTTHSNELILSLKLRPQQGLDVWWYEGELERKVEYHPNQNEKVITLIPKRKGTLKFTIYPCLN